MLPKESRPPGWTATQDSEEPDSRRRRPTITSHTGSQASARANQALQPVDRPDKLAHDIAPKSALLSTVSAQPKQANSESSTTVWMFYAVLGLFLMVYFGSLLLRRGGQHWVWLDGWAVCGVELAAGGLCLARGWAPRPGRAAALILGASILSWSAGDIALTIESLGGATPPTPSLADLFYLGFYPLAYVALVTFVRGAVGKLGTSNWMDGAIAGLGAAAA
ncbi:MAG TPA: hypothetical protein VG815_01835, partial [Chloroflexota bacterium]|nr:hypothetical protein [Chloroflexota bacterium]